MGLYLLNSSVDNPDVSSSAETANHNFNDAENLVELVVEHVLGFEKAIAEYDDSHCDDGGDKSAKSKVEFIQRHETLDLKEVPFVLMPEGNVPHYVNPKYLSYKNVESPPPNC